MHKRKINKKTFNMPDGWHDVTFDNAMTIIKDNLNNVEIFSLLSGIPITEVKKLNKGEDVHYFLEGFPFLKKLPDINNPQVPRTIKYKGERYSFPHVLLDDEFDFGNTNVDQIEDMKAIIVNMNKDILKDEDRQLTHLELFEIYPYITAVYLQPIIEKNYSHARAMRMAKSIKAELSFKEVLNMGNFFFQKSIGSINGFQKGSLLPNWMTRKYKQGRRILVRLLDSMLP